MMYPSDNFDTDKDILYVRPSLYTAAILYGLEY